MQGLLIIAPKKKCPFCSEYLTNDEQYIIEKKLEKSQTVRATHHCTENVFVVAHQYDGTYISYIL